MRAIRDSYFWAICLNHFAVDLLNTQRVLILVFLSATLTLTNNNIGLIGLFATSFGALSQPFWGLWADRWKLYWLAPVGLLWIAGWHILAFWIGGKFAIVCVIFAALGSGAFHPVGTERASARGKVVFDGKIGMASGLFFLAGQLGLSLGPLVGGQLLSWWGLNGLLLLCSLAVPVAFWVFQQVRQPLSGTPAAQQTPANPPPAERSQIRWRLLLIFVVFVFLRTVPNHFSMDFLPKLLKDRGYAPNVYGALASVFMAGSALGVVLGGYLSDRMGHRNVLLTMLLFSIPFFWLYPTQQNPLWLAILAAFAGFGSGSAHPIIVVAAQSFFPRKQAMASGLSLGMIFVTGALGSWLLSIWADRVGVATAIQLSGLLLIPAVLLVPLVFQKQTKAL
jgi:FSR family fosmidomycin resistance protein-like MFS transporter